MNKYENQKSNFKNNKKNDVVYVNENIRARQIRLVDDGYGNNRGIIDFNDALSIAYEQNLDLVQISYHDGVSICKIIDYGKYQYEQKKREKDAKKQAKANIQDLKEVCFSIRIDDGDKAVKIRHIREFIADNCKVKLAIFFAKREMDRLEYGKNILKEIVMSLEDVVEFDVLPKLEGRKLSCIVKPKKQK